MTEIASEYEAKRLRRITENRQKLQELNISSLASNLFLKTKPKKRKREIAEKLTEPTRKSPRQRKQQRIEKQQRKLEKRKKDEVKERKKARKLEKKKRKLKKEKKREKKLKKELKEKKNEDKKQEIEELNKGENVDQETKDEENGQEPKMLDWRLRRKLQAKEERRLAILKKREKQKMLTLKKQLKLKKIKLKERKLRKRQQEKERMERIVQKELEYQQKLEERELMREEDRLARQVAKQRVKDEKNKKRQERNVMVNELLEEIITEEQKLARQKEDELNKVIYPVHKIDLPLVHISDPIESYKRKPLLLSPFLNVDVNFFHAFSLGKQFLPPGKKSVMLGQCPGGFTTTFQDHVDIHVWKNAMTLFVSGTTGIFYQYMFEEAMHDEKKYTIFRWTRTQNVTPQILWRMCQIRKGEECLHLNKSYYDATTPTQKPEPLLLFVQYPKALKFVEKGVMTNEALSEYEVSRRRRIEENRRMLSSLALPNISRSSSRSQASKVAVELEPTRRSSRQRTRRETFKQQEIVANQQNVQNNKQQMQQIAIIASEKQQLKRKRKQQREIKAQEMAKKKQKIEERKFERFQNSKQREIKLQLAEKKQQQVIETRKRQMERQKQHELPPEIVAKRNADIQKFIHEELNKQACLAREEKQLESEHQRFGQEQMLKQDEVQEQIATTGLVKENKTVGIDEFEEAALMEAVMGESEYELVL